MTIQFEIFCGTDTNGHDLTDERGRFLTPAIGCAPGSRQHRTACARQLALNLAAEYFPQGHTIRDEVGRWQTADGRMITESTTVITWMADAGNPVDAERRVSAVAGAYKELAFQESVMVTRREVDAVFI